MTLITWRKYDRSDGTKKAYHEDQIKFCLWMILMKGLMDAIKHMRKLDDMNHDSHLDPWM
jgi:hypothetical protein